MFGKEKDIKAFEAGVNTSSPTFTEAPPPPYEAGNHRAAAVPANFQSPIPELIPHPAKLLTIHARGTGSWYCSSNELVIPIYLGTDITQQPLYVSTRAKKSSNSAILSHRTEGNIISTVYRWGFGKSRQPKIRYIRKEASYGNDVFKGLSDDEDAGPVALTATTNGWTNTTTMTSDINPGQVLTWRYIKTFSTDKPKLRVMALYADSVSSSSRGKGEGEPVAVLVRSENTRTPGTTRWDAGNGGQLILNNTVSDLVDEGLIVASCLMCLKKENDRNRDATVAAST